MPRRRPRPRNSSSSESGDEYSLSRPTQRRRSARGNHALSELAKEICLYRKRVVFIAGAGISVASGIRQFRGNGGVWTTTIWTNATREAFRKNPRKWYNDFWLPNLSLPVGARPNAAHHALSDLLRRYPETLSMITQNVDGLSESSPQLIEAHGRLGLYKCMPEEDSDTDSEDDDDDERLVHLGHRRKRRLAMKKNGCRYQQQESLTVDDLEPPNVRGALDLGRGRLLETPRCPACQNPVAPQALLFDEGYHSHDFYRFQDMEEWLAKAEVIVFVGTSFSVRLPEIALEHARAESIPVYNFNVQDMLESTARLDATNVKGPSEKSLPFLLQEVKELEETLGIRTENHTKDLSSGTAESTTTCNKSPGTVQVIS